MREVIFILALLLCLVPVVSAEISYGYDDPVLPKVVFDDDDDEPVPTSFLDLTDTPGTYVGSGGLCVAVYANETGLEFIPCGNATGNATSPWTDNAAANTLHPTNLSRTVAIGADSTTLAVLEGAFTDLLINRTVDNDDGSAVGSVYMNEDERSIVSLMQIAGSTNFSIGLLETYGPDINLTNRWGDNLPWQNKTILANYNIGGHPSGLVFLTDGSNMEFSPQAITRMLINSTNIDMVDTLGRHIFNVRYTNPVLGGRGVISMGENLPVFGVDPEGDFITVSNNLSLGALFSSAPIGMTGRNKHVSHNPFHFKAMNDIENYLEMVTYPSKYTNSFASNKSVITAHAAVSDLVLSSTGDTASIMFNFGDGGSVGPTAGNNFFSCHGGTGNPIDQGYGCQLGTNNPWNSSENNGTLYISNDANINGGPQTLLVESNQGGKPALVVSGNSLGEISTRLNGRLLITSDQQSFFAYNPGTSGTAGELIQGFNFGDNGLPIPGGASYIATINFSTNNTKFAFFLTNASYGAGPAGLSDEVLILTVNDNSDTHESGGSLRIGDCFGALKCDDPEATIDNRGTLRVQDNATFNASIINNADSWCNATSCYTIADFLNGSGGGGSLAASLWNDTKTLLHPFNLNRSVSIGTTQAFPGSFGFMANNSIDGTATGGSVNNYVLNQDLTNAISAYTMGVGRGAFGAAEFGSLETYGNATDLTNRWGANPPWQKHTALLNFPTTGTGGIEMGLMVGGDFDVSNGASLFFRVNSTDVLVPNTHTFAVRDHLKVDSTSTQITDNNGDNLMRTTDTNPIVAGIGLVQYGPITPVFGVDNDADWITYVSDETLFGGGIIDSLGWTVSQRSNRTGAHMRTMNDVGTELKMWNGPSAFSVFGNTFPANKSIITARDTTDDAELVIDVEGDDASFMLAMGSGGGGGPQQNRVWLGCHLGQGAAANDGCMLGGDAWNASEVQGTLFITDEDFGSGKGVLHVEQNQFGGQTDAAIFAEAIGYGGTAIETYGVINSYNFGEGFNLIRVNADPTPGGISSVQNGFGFCYGGDEESACAGGGARLQAKIEADTNNTRFTFELTNYTYNGGSPLEDEVLVLFVDDLSEDGDSGGSMRIGDCFGVLNCEPPNATADIRGTQWVKDNATFFDDVNMQTSLYVDDLISINKSIRFNELFNVTITPCNLNTNFGKIQFFNTSGIYKHKACNGTGWQDLY